MSNNRSKRYAKAAELVDSGKMYPLDEAVATVKKFPAPKFDPTVTLSFHLGVDPRKSDQMVRGSVSLPHGTGKNVRVAVFAQGEAAKAAEEAGAEHVGFEELIKKVQDGFTDFDAAIASTMRTTGRAVLFTTVVLTSAFSIYGFATAESVVAFGLLTALAVFLAFFLDLFLTPALLALVYRRRAVA